jgi:hypothetical protein
MVAVDAGSDPERADDAQILLASTPSWFPERKPGEL